MGRPASSLPRITFRLSHDLAQKLEHAARDNGTSLNSEIVARLEKTFGGVADESDDLRSEVARLNDYAKNYGRILDEYRRDNHALRIWLGDVFEAQKAKRDLPEPPFPLDKPLSGAKS